MSTRSRLLAALKRRVRGPYGDIGRLDQRLVGLEQRLSGIEQSVVELRELAVATRNLLGGEIHTLLAEMNATVHGEQRGVLRALVSEEAENRRRLHRLRAEEQYSVAWTEPRPLVSVTIATRDRPELLSSRSLPAILGQTYGELEVIVVGDAADEATAEAVRSLDDPRLLYRNLTQRLRFTEDPQQLWLVGSTMARNEANRLARGRWLISVDDDDAIRPDCVERLLACAGESRLECVYGRVQVHGEGLQPFEMCSFPPSHGQFTWAAGMYHSGLRFFERELVAAELGLPGDWFLAERMLRAGVRFGMVDSVLGDTYPSKLNAPQSPGTPL
jgi:hypothetical protein